MGSIVSTFTQVPGLEETGRAKKKNKQQRAEMPKFLYKHSLPVREKRLQETSVLLLSIAVKAKQVTLCKHDTASLAPIGAGLEGCRSHLSSNLHLLRALEYDL